jgi:HEAT repeat protein
LIPLQEEWEMSRLIKVLRVATIWMEPRYRYEPDPWSDSPNPPNVRVVEFDQTDWLVTILVCLQYLCLRSTRKGLECITRFHGNGEVEDVAARRLAKLLTKKEKSQQVLCKLARDHDVGLVRWEAVEKVTSQEVLAEVATDVQEVSGVRLAAITRLLDAAALAKTLVDEDCKIREVAAKRLAEIGVPIIDPLCNALRDADSGVRQRAAEALGNLGNARASLGRLAVALDDADNGVRRCAAMAIAKMARQAAKIGDGCAVGPLCRALGDSDAEVRGRAAEALVELGDESAVEPLCMALEDSSRWTRWHAAEALEKFGDARAIGPLCRVLDDQDSTVREHAARALGSVGDERAVGPLCAVLSDNEQFPRRAAANALLKIGDASAVGPLCDALWSVDGYVRELAAATLGRIGDVRAVDPLCGSLSYSGGNVRRSVSEALGKIGDARAVRLVVLCLSTRRRGLGSLLCRLL